VIVGVVRPGVTSSDPLKAEKASTTAEAGALLLLGEADALFGNRDEMKVSHNRYANLEV
jgi:hypothetical protein